MSKINRITVSNLKAVSSQTANFEGMTAIITGGNNKGKTSFLRSLFDRVRGTKPDKVLKEGETEGFAEVELTSKEKLRWEFNDKGNGFKEKLTYITDKDVKTSLTTELRNRFLPQSFDVDKFLQDQPAKQRKTLQELVGIDFSDVDSRYKSAYEDRESKNRRYNEEKIILGKWVVPENVEAVDLSELSTKKEAIRKNLNDTYVSNKKANDDARKLWGEQCDTLREDIRLFNNEQEAKKNRYDDCVTASAMLRGYGYNDESLELFLSDMLKNIQQPKVFEPLTEPDYIEEMPDKKELDEIDEKIIKATETNNKAQAHRDWVKQKEKTESFSTEAAEADKLVKAIEKERMDLIKSAKMPEGFGFSDDGITYNGLSFTREQLSSSGIYIAALKLAAMNLGEIKTIHFDASFLDKISLADIEKWAIEQDLQLLIERPDFEGGEIEYQTVQL